MLGCFVSHRFQDCSSGASLNWRPGLILTIERLELAMETLGVNLTEGKALLAGVQDFVVAQQAREELEQRRACPHCRRRYTTKDSGSTPVSTVFGRVEVPNPRWNRCGCGRSVPGLSVQ